MLVVLLGPDDPLYHTYISAYKLKADGSIKETIFHRAETESWVKNLPKINGVKFDSSPDVVHSPDDNLTSVLALGDDGYIYRTQRSCIYGNDNII